MLQRVKMSPLRPDQLHRHRSRIVPCTAIRSGMRALGESVNVGARVVPLVNVLNLATTHGLKIWRRLPPSLQIWFWEARKVALQGVERSPSTRLAAVEELFARLETRCSPKSLVLPPLLPAPTLIEELHPAPPRRRLSPQVRIVLIIVTVRSFQRHFLLKLFLLHLYVIMARTVVQP